MAQNETDSILDARMVIAAECLANPDFGGTKEDIANAAGVSRTTLYRWMRNSDFVEIVNSLVAKYANAELGMIWKALTRRCQSGDVSAMRLYFELRGQLDSTKPKQENAELLEILEQLEQAPQSEEDSY